MLSLGSCNAQAQVRRADLSRAGDDQEKVAAGVVRELLGGRLQREQEREREAEYGSAGAFIPSVTAQRSTGNERLRASNQEHSGHHVTRDTPMGCYCTALSKT